MYCGNIDRVFKEKCNGLKKMVTKSLLYKYTYQNISSVDSLPKIEIDNISQLLVDIDRIWLQKGC